MELIKDFNTRVEDAQKYLSIARCSDLQQEVIGQLGDLQKEIKEKKCHAICEADENKANLFLGYQCVTGALMSELEMWVLLKKEDPDRAWDQLVYAQRASVSAARAHKGFSHLKHNYERLLGIEKLVFPPQVFISSGMIVKSQICSICGSEYGDCIHLIGKPYMGEFCYVIARDAEVDHVAIVDHPADKSCRVINFSEPEGMRNRMTWRIKPNDVSES